MHTMQWGDFISKEKFIYLCQEVSREESRIAYKIPILAGNGPPQSIYGSFGQSKKYSIFLKHPTFSCFHGQKWYFVTKIVLTYCEKKLF